MGPKQILAFTVGPIVSAALGLITLPIVAWFYSVEDVGRIAMLRVVSSFCILLFGLGLDQAYVREYHEAEDKPALLKMSVMPGMYIVIVVLSISFIRPTLISEMLFATNSLEISLLVALCIVAAFISRFLSLILRMQERGLAYSMSQILPRLVFLLVIGFFVLFSYTSDLHHLVFAQVISVVSVTVLYGWNTRQEWLMGLEQKIDLMKLREMLRYGAPLIIGGAASWGLTTMDRLFLRGMSTFTELGIYSVASSFAAAAIIFQGIFSTIWAPIVYKWVAEGRNLEKVEQTTEYVLAVVVILFSLAGIFSWIVPYFLPASYNGVQYILVCCMGYPLFYTLSETTVVGISIVRKSIYSMMASIIAVLFNIAGNYLLVPRYGAGGAAISTATAFWIFLILRTEFSCHLWRKMRRLKLYLMTGTVLILSVSLALKGDQFHAYFIAAWILVLVTAMIMFRDMIKTKVIAPIRMKF